MKSYLIFNLKIGQICLLDSSSVNKKTVLFIICLPICDAHSMEKRDISTLIIMSKAGEQFF